MNSNAQDSIAENFSCHHLVLRCHHFCSLVPDGCTRGRVAGSPRSGENRSSDTIRRSLRREIERIAKLDQRIERHHEAEGVAVALVIDQFLDSHSWRQALPLTAANPPSANVDLASRTSILATRIIPLLWFPPAGAFAPTPSHQRDEPRSRPPPCAPPSAHQITP